MIIRDGTGVHLAQHDGVVLSRLTLTTHELPHQVARHLRRRPVEGLRLGHKVIAQLGFELHREDGVFWHDGLLLGKVIQSIWEAQIPETGSIQRPGICWMQGFSQLLRMLLGYASVSTGQVLALLATPATRLRRASTSM